MSDKEATPTGEEATGAEADGEVKTLTGGGEVTEEVKTDGSETLLGEDGTEGEKPEGDEGSKDADGEGADKDADGKADGKSDQAPEQYEDFTLPEGMEIDTETLEAATPVFKELNLTQEQAQKLVSLQAEYVQKQADAAQKAWTDVKTEWREATQKDAEIGGANFKTALAIANNAIEKLGTKELREVLNSVGVGNHPEFVRFAYKVGKAIGEDTVETGKGKSGEADDWLARMYPSMAKQS